MRCYPPNTGYIYSHVCMCMINDVFFAAPIYYDNNNNSNIYYTAILGDAEVFKTNVLSLIGWTIFYTVQFLYLVCIS